VKVLIKKKIPTVFHPNFLIAKGPDHMGLFISPVNDVKLVKWSILEDFEVPKSGPKWQNRDTHFIYYFSTNSSKEFNFHLDIEVRAFTITNEKEN
jgi:hypothetical protein